MLSNNPWQSYRRIATETASPGQLVLMLYEGAIKFLEKSLTGFELTDPREFNQTVNNNLLRAGAILSELNLRLDMERGGEVSENFRRLYHYLIRRVNEANLKKSKKPIEEVLRHLLVHRDSWAEMLARGPATDAPNAAETLAALPTA